MNDPIYASLFKYAQPYKVDSLLILTENNPDIPDVFKQILIITNSFDVFLEKKSQGFNIEVSDFDFSKIADASLSQIILRVPKSKSMCLYILNECARILKTEGRLLIAGANSEGIVTTFKHASTCIGRLEKHSLEGAGIRFGCILKTSTPNIENKLDDKNYAVLRLISPKILHKCADNFPLLKLYIDDLKLFTKPGLYGFDKIDAGSAFLMETMAALILKEYKKEDEKENEKCINNDNRLLELISYCSNNIKVLDLGCGDGFLSLILIKIIKQYQQKNIKTTAYKADQITALSSPEPSPMELSSIELSPIDLSATDSNAAAILVCQHNFSVNKIKARVFQDDCGKSLSANNFDLILCNPPFHEGFKTSLELSIKFINQIKCLLNKDKSVNAQAWIVVNKFLKFEQLAQDIGLDTKIITQNDKFKVLVLIKKH
ncbi:hypothetical protein AwWohl_02590 [Gammaproteobacteria bacterium]|nr:hypothetical protein AwWohl_02590 [Gammaproteobacteria bacterium]